MSWDERFRLIASVAASWSKDPQRKVGAVIIDGRKRIVGIGYNGLPRKVKDSEERLSNTETRGLMTVHAEVNAILNAAIPRSEPGIMVMFSTSFPCAGCAGIIIQSRITRIDSPPPEGDSGWSCSWDVALAMFTEAGVIVTSADKHED